MCTDGWVGVGWPKEWGGQGMTAIEQFVFFDESMRAGAPVPMLTLNTVGPTIMNYGTQEQREFFIPKILAGDIHFCIGYSEPGAGTDLAALKTRAVRDGDEYIINGQKTWTSLAGDADYIWLAVRTNPEVKKHKGISLLLVPMDTPGITVQPLHLMGEHNINHVYFDDVRVPVSTCVGGENNGWSLITNQLNHERVTLCASGGLERLLDEITAVGQGHDAARRPPRDRPGVGAAQHRPPPRQDRRAAPDELAGRVGSHAGQDGRRPLLGDQGVRHRVEHRGVQAAHGGRRLRVDPRQGHPGRRAPVAPRELDPQLDHPHVRRWRQRGPTRPHQHVRVGFPESEPVMDFSFSSDQEALRDLTRQIVSARATNDHLKDVKNNYTDATDLELWKQLAEAGLVGIGLPEAADGGGLGFLELALVLSECGRAAAPVPALGGLLGSAAVAEYGTADDLAGVASGEKIITFAVHEQVGDPYVPYVTADGSTVTGEKVVVPSGTTASAFVVTTTDGLYLVARPPRA